MNNQFPHLLSPLQIGKLKIKNRMCMAPMGGGYADLQGPHGEYNETALEYFTERARGGFGLIVAGALYPDNLVDPCDQSFCFMNYPDAFMKQAHRLTENCGLYGTKVFQQLSMGLGRNYAGLYAPSKLEVWGAPNVESPELTRDQIKAKIERVVSASKLMKDCGFDGVEIHAMHWGYLLDQFAMSITNHREDEYGGCLENRLRAAREIVEGVKQVCGADFPVSMRMGLKSYISGLNKRNFSGENEKGRTIEEAVEIARLLESYGYDVLNVDVGVYDTFYHAAAPMYMPQGHVIPLAAQVKEAVDIPILCGSRMNDPAMGEQAIAEGKIDGIVLGRPAMADPFYPRKVAMGRPDKIRPCIGCNSCVYKIFDGCEHVTCAVNPQVQKETYYRPTPALVKKNVAVVGGGIAGMEAARTAKMRGHNVTIYEKSDHLGGLLLPASAHVFKKELRQLVEWYKSEIAELQIPVVYHADLDAEAIRRLSPDTVIVASGSHPVVPPIPGHDHPKCRTGVDVLTNHPDLGKKIVVVGGGLVGCECAVDFAMQGIQVTLVEALPEILCATKMISPSVGQMIPDLLEHYHVEVKAGHKIMEVNDRGAVIAPMAGGESQEIEADTVILSIGMRSNDNLEGQLYGDGIEVYTVGDCQHPGNVYTCVHSAYDAARTV